ncbi:exodeoxyribonuclease VII large subunit [Empedobacter sp. R132-2]|uniref:exodeoxyribonuclease VII large subunit n=1 Tax=Empedobacter sp. R132-2 TaxID=2746740 RepID=UPI002576F4A0|nr:exodeoxyribonuclease VII large subunit [Empedobacter sp. R132-2]MDM1138402.1 hypothetical protein [Empedobacter sp. R132-2]
MNQIIESNIQIYSPQSIIGIFNNALKLPVTTSLIYIKGKYTYGHGKSYAGYYYDFLYAEASPSSIGTKISTLLRSKLINNESYVLRGFIEKRIKNSSIELVFVVDEIIQQEEKTISEEDLQKFEIIQNKLNKEVKNIETLIREKIARNETIKVANIYGHNAIVQRDFYEGLGIVSQNFILDDYTCNITSATSIFDQLQEVQTKGYDIIGIVRGGGDKQSFDAFDDIRLAKYFISLKSITITAIGHTVDETLLDKLSDKRYNLPLDYGVGLNKIVEKITLEKSNSRAILIDEVKKDVQKQFQEQVKTLETQLNKRNLDFKTLQDSSQKSVKDLSDEVQKMNQTRSVEIEKTRKDLELLHQKHTDTVLENERNKNNLQIQKLIQEINNLKNELNKTKNSSSLTIIIITLIIGLILGFFLFK